MNRFVELARGRRSVRGYESTPVEPEKLERILEAARWAPTACNRQPFQLIVLRVEGREEELLRVYERDWFVEAPIVIAACGLPSASWIRRDGKNYNDIDVAIVMDHLILAAADEGLGTCWVAAFDPVAARKLLGLPENVEPIAFTPLGYGSDEPRPKERKPIDALVRYDRW